MAKFGASDSIRLRDSGRPANIVAQVGSAFKVVLVYSGPDGDATNLQGWSLDAKAELYRGLWDADDNLTKLYGRPIGDAVELTAEAMEDQTANPGVFLLSVDSALLPAGHRQPSVGVDVLPTFATWIRFSGPGGVVDQARVAIGFRRGIGSLATGGEGDG